MEVLNWVVLVITLLGNLFLLGFLFLSGWIISYYRSQNIYKKMKDCICGDRLNYFVSDDHRSYNDYLRDFASHFFRDYYESLQYKTNINKKYIITKEERHIAGDIIICFQQWLIKLYFRGELFLKEYTKMTTEYFFIDRLVYFFRQNELEWSFNEQEMFEIERKTNNHLKLHLKDYSRVYFKMFYVCLMYHETNLFEKIAPENTSFTPTKELELIEEYLEKGYIEVNKR